MQTLGPLPGPVADAPRHNWVDRRAPDWLKPYARLARWDRPIGFWLLFWPCAIAILMAGKASGQPIDWAAIALMFVGSVAMRGAGCTFNDIVDADIDERVERTRLRPIPSRQVSVRNAVLFMAAQVLVGFVVLMQFNWTTIVLGASSLVLVAIYPFMKRVTWWPQLFLGFSFSWGAIVGWTAVTGSFALAPALLYAGCILWVIGYDTIYAMQDIEDDAIVGVKSTARLFGARGRVVVGGFYIGAMVLWLFAAVSAGIGPVSLALLAVPAIVLAWQVVTLEPALAANTLERFRANQWVGAFFALALLIGGLF